MTISALRHARAVIAAGTTVVRALESYGATGAPAGTTDLVID